MELQMFVMEEFLNDKLLVALTFLVKYKTSLEFSHLHLMMYKGVSIISGTSAAICKMSYSWVDVLIFYVLLFGVMYMA
jgi:hypothetical protein